MRKVTERGFEKGNSGNEEGEGKERDTHACREKREWGRFFFWLNPRKPLKTKINKNKNKKEKKEQKTKNKKQKTNKKTKCNNNNNSQTHDNNVEAFMGNTLFSF